MNEWADKIDEYLTGRLPAEERAAFEAQVRLDPDLARDLAFTKALIQATGEADVLELRQKMAVIAGDMPRVAQPGRRWKGYWAGGIFVLLLTVFLYYLWFRTAPEPAPGPSVIPSSGQPPVTDTTGQSQKTVAGNLPAGQPKPTAPPVKQKDNLALQSGDQRNAALADAEYGPGYSVVMRGVESSEGDRGQLQRAEAAYLEGNFAGVIDLLDPLPAGADAQVEALKLRAHAKFRQHLYAGAAADFDALVQKSQSYRYDAEWYRLLCHTAQRPAVKEAYQQSLAAILGPRQRPHPFRERAIRVRQQVAGMDNE